MNNPVIVPSYKSKAFCTRSPMGKDGLEGFQLGDRYEYHQEVYDDGSCKYVVFNGDPKTDICDKYKMTGLLFRRYFKKEHISS